MFSVRVNGLIALFSARAARADGGQAPPLTRAPGPAPRGCFYARI